MVKCPNCGAPWKDELEILVCPCMDDWCDEEIEEFTCHRKVCDNPDPTYYNHSTREYYCGSCAMAIQEYENTMKEPFCIFTEFYVPNNSPFNDKMEEHESFGGK